MKSEIHEYMGSSRGLIQKKDYHPAFSLCEIAQADDDLSIQNCIANVFDTSPLRSLHILRIRIALGPKSIMVHFLIVFRFWLVREKREGK